MSKEILRQLESNLLPHRILHRLDKTITQEFSVQPDNHFITQWEDHKTGIVEFITTHPVSFPEILELTTSFYQQEGYTVSPPDQKSPRTFKVEKGNRPYWINLVGNANNHRILVYPAPPVYNQETKLTLAF